MKKVLKHKKSTALHIITNQCKGCKLKHHRRKIVIGRGSIPARILFIGEGPGKTEDLLGEPFVGVSGNLLNTMIEEAAQEAGVKPPSYYLTNIVFCRPWIWREDDPEYGRKRDPFRSEILACMPYVMRIVKQVRPELVVFVGRMAENYYRKEFRDGLHITHPAAHLRFGGRCSPTYALDVRNLSEAFKRLSR